MAEKRTTDSARRSNGDKSLHDNEELFRLITENVTDLIAVVEGTGRRLYCSKSYERLLGDVKGPEGCLESIHPEDRPRVRAAFAEMLASGKGQRLEYRMVTPQGVRHLESHASVIQDSEAHRLLLVARDVTDRKEAIEVLRQALADLSETHEELKATQRQLMEAERVQAVSTFAAGVAHEVKNPLQTIILGIDYLSHNLPKGDEAAATGVGASRSSARMVLDEMAQAVHRADAIIRGLMEFASTARAESREENLNDIVEHAVRALETELREYPVQFVKNLSVDLPPTRLEARIMKHVFINLLLYAVRSLSRGGRLVLSTFTRTWSGPSPGATGGFSQLKVGDRLVVVQIECVFPPADTPEVVEPKSAAAPASLGLTVLKKIVELYGGAIETVIRKGISTNHAVMFRPQTDSKL